MAKTTQFPYLSILWGLSALPIEVTHQRQHTSTTIKWATLKVCAVGRWGWIISLTHGLRFFFKHFVGAWEDDGFQLRKHTINHGGTMKQMRALQQYYDSDKTLQYQNNN